MPQTVSPGSHAHIPPPTTLTLLYNPLIGFISSAYSAQVSPTVALSTRFGVNVYSYESDLSVGGEWFIGRGRGKRDNGSATLAAPAQVASPGPQAIPANMSLRPTDTEDVTAEKRLDSPTPLNRAPVASPPSQEAPAYGELDRDGVLKARMSGNWVSTIPCDHGRNSETEGQADPK